ncbi:MAG: HNH endonuclease, partial [Gammaproteobacteria bacterium]|nr:HNH endonuclease [Gammaproteobacteria bacterium]
LKLPIVLWKPFENTRKKVRTTGDIRTPSGKTLAPGLDRGGYKIVGLRLAGKKITFKVHYLVCVTFNGVRPTGAECVRHLDGNKLNNRNSNLRWGTSKENAQDTILHGRQVCGFDHPNVSILKTEARAIREEYLAHMAERKKAKNGFILTLVDSYAHLTYKCVYRAAKGAYDEME